MLSPKEAGALPFSRSVREGGLLAALDVQRSFVGSRSMPQVRVRCLDANLGLGTLSLPFFFHDRMP